MLSADTIQHEIIWNRLRNPISQTHLPQDYLSLLAALDTGWMICGPVRLLCVGESNDYSAYLFNLGHQSLSQTVQLAVSPGPIVEKFLCEEGVAVLVSGNAQNIYPLGLVC